MPLSDLITVAQQDKIERSQSLGASALRSLLGGAAILWQTAAALRSRAYDSGFFAVERYENPYIISVGNLNAGGSGKTPVVTLLLDALGDVLRCAVISRGYRGAYSGTAPLLLNDGGGLRHTASFAGDEPALLARRYPACSVFVSRDRCRAARAGAARDAQLIILDDGFQHRRLGRHCDIVVIDAKRPPWQDRLLPRGTLREGPSSLRRANLLVCNGIRDAAEWATFTSILRRWSDAPAIGVAPRIAKICGWHDTICEKPHGKKAALFCGIAHPRRFFETVQQMDVNVVDFKPFADHCTFATGGLEQYANEALQKGAQMLLCSEKDAVKYADDPPALPLPLYWPQLALEIVAGEEQWHQFLREVRHAASR